MDIEFHYHMTYLIAAKAGFGPDDAQIIAQASQYTDDNDTIFEVDKGKETAYQNFISQTMNILKPRAKLFRIYPIFHFIPGNVTGSTAWRKDGEMHWLNTTPNSKNAKQIIDSALSEKDLYRIGIACHGYADTWAHQNFVGQFGVFNAVAGPLETLTPNVGHADARHDPDWPALVWQDKRLLGKLERVDNKARFLDAAKYMLRKLTKYVDPNISSKSLGTRTASLGRDLKWAIGIRDQNNSLKSERIARYKELSGTPDYGNRELETYDEDKWLAECTNEEVRGLRDRSDIYLARWDPMTDIFTWKDPEHYRESHWYRFQEAVKRHQSETFDILKETNLRGLELPEW
ncbi:MAG: hypothetical protein GY856_08145 [bacterium]|nr:hypothetical protein [bacterium]